MINKDIFQQIYNELEKFLPSEWNKVVAYFEYGHADFDYTDLTDCAFQYMKDWKNKYLK